MSASDTRAPAVAGSFYPRASALLGPLVAALYESAAGLPRGSRLGRDPRLPLGLLVPHAGLVFSGVTAAAAWACLDPGPGAPGVRGRGATAGEPLTVVILGTNHGAAWFEGVGAWEAGAWATPLGEVTVDAALAERILGLGAPFAVDRAAHRGEHAIEVQLPLLATVAPSARIVPLAVSFGTGTRAVDAGERLGGVLASCLARGERVVLAISTDMAHYPAADSCAEVTERLLPRIAALDPVGLAALEDSLRDSRIPGLACGMCGIEPAVLGLAALRAAGATTGTMLAATTSADAGGPPDRTVGYLSVRFDA